MPYITRDDWSGDLGRHRLDVHYRLYVSPRDNQVAVICAQDHDYLDYDARRILSPEVYETEAEAEGALIDLLPAISRAGHAVPDGIDVDLRGRMVAAIVRERVAREVQR